MDETFDPVAAGAVAVDEPFDPTAHGAVPVEQPKPSIPALAGRTAWDVIKQVTGLHQPTSLSEVAQEIFPTHFENTLVGGMLGGAKRTFEQGIAAAKTPDFSPEKFAFAGNVVGQAGGQLLGLLGLKAEPAIAKTAPTLAETAGIAKPDIAQPVEPVATDAVAGTPKTFAPAEVPYNHETQIIPGTDTRFTMVDEPPPDIAPARPIYETIRYQPTERPGQDAPLAQDAFPSISQSAEEARRTARTTETGIESETAKIGGDTNASEIPSPESVPIPTLREEVGGEAPLRQQGETAGTREGSPPENAGTTPQEVTPEIPEGAKATVNFKTSSGKLVPKEMDAREAEGIFTKEKSSYQALLNCLGA